MSKNITQKLEKSIQHWRSRLQNLSAKRQNLDTEITAANILILTEKKRLDQQKFYQKIFNKKSLLPKLTLDCDKLIAHHQETTQSLKELPEKAENDIINLVLAQDLELKKKYTQAKKDKNTHARKVEIHQNIINRIKKSQSLMSGAHNSCDSAHDMEFWDLIFSTGAMPLISFTFTSWAINDLRKSRDELTELKEYLHKHKMDIDLDTASLGIFNVIDVAAMIIPFVGMAVSFYNLHKLEKAMAKLHQIDAELDKIKDTFQPHLNEHQSKLSKTEADLMLLQTLAYQRANKDTDNQAAKVIEKFKSAALTLKKSPLTSTQQKEADIRAEKLAKQQAKEQKRAEKIQKMLEKKQQAAQKKADKRAKKAEQKQKHKKNGPSR